MLDLLPTVADVLDEPFADASILPTYLLSRFTREPSRSPSAVTAATSSSPGYPTFAADRVARLLPRAACAPRARRRAARRPAPGLDRQLQLRLQAEAVPPRCRARRARSDTRRGSARSRRAEQASSPRAGARRPARGAAARASRARRPATGSSASIYLYAKTYLQDDILVKVDRASMAYSLEVRAPFLDVDLVEFLGRVPPRLKLRRFDTKHLLKRAMADVLPPGIASGQEGIRDSRRRVVQGRAPRRASGRALARSGSRGRGSSTRRRCSG